MPDHAKTLLGELPFPPAPEDRISRFFTVRELTRSEIAARRGIPNGFPSRRELEAAVHLARTVLDPVRERFGPFTPNSVFRSQAVERALKGKPDSWTSRSRHARGEAADVEIAGVPNLALARWIEANLPFDQLILEMHDPALGPNSGWVHVSLRPEAARNRREALRYVRIGGRWRYLPGLSDG